MIGIIDVGGGLRGIFGAGVTDFLMEESCSTTAWEFLLEAPIWPAIRLGKCSEITISIQNTASEARP